MEVFFFLSLTSHCKNNSSLAQACPVTDAVQEAEVDKGTAIDVYQWFREVCPTKLLQTLDP